MKLKINIKGVQNKEKFISDSLRPIGNRVVEKIILNSNGDLLFKYSKEFISGKTIVKQVKKEKYLQINKFLENFYKQHINSNRVWMLYKVIEFEGYWLIFFITKY